MPGRPALAQSRTVRRGTRVKLPASGLFTQWLFTQPGPAEARRGDTTQEAGEGSGLVERAAGGGDQSVHLIPEVWWYFRQAAFRELGAA